MDQTKSLYHNLDLNKTQQIFNVRKHNVTTAQRIELGNTLNNDNKGLTVFDINLLRTFDWSGQAWTAIGTSFEAAQTIYVDPNGDNSNSGKDIQLPKKTITNTIHHLVSGDVLKVNRGVYIGNLTITAQDVAITGNSVTGSAGAFPTILGDVSTGPGTRLNNIRISGSLTVNSTVFSTYLTSVQTGTLDITGSQPVELTEVKAGITTIGGSSTIFIYRGTFESLSINNTGFTRLQHCIAGNINVTAGTFVARDLDIISPNVLTIGAGVKYSLPGVTGTVLIDPNAISLETSMVGDEVDAAIASAAVTSTFMKLAMLTPQENLNPTKAVTFNETTKKLEISNFPTSSGGDSASLVQTVRNENGVSLMPGEVVYMEGVAADQLLAYRADNTLASNITRSYGVVISEIPDQQNGLVLISGILTGIDTSMYATGDTLWLGTDGAFTGLRPMPPNRAVFIGTVIVSDTNAGKIDVRIGKEYGISDLYNVDISSATPGQAVILSNDGVWRNKDVTSDYNSLTNKPDLTVYAEKSTLKSVATSGAYADLTGKPVLAAVATSGSYSDLSSKPDLSGYVVGPSLAAVATSGAYADLTGKPDLAVYAKSADLKAVALSGAYSDLTGAPDLATYAQTASLAAVALSGNYADLAGVPNLSVYAQVANLAAVASSGAYADLLGTPDLLVYAKSADLADVATSGSYADLVDRPALAPVATSGDYNDLTNRPNYSSPFVPYFITSVETWEVDTNKQALALMDLTIDGWAQTDGFIVEVST